MTVSPAIVRMVLSTAVMILGASWHLSCCAQDTAKPMPSKRNVSYGPHERNVLDFWQVKSDNPTPLAIYIHGGGFRAGSKDGINVRTLRELLQSRISVAALNYRLTGNAPLPAAHDDCQRAIQFLRSKADAWNFDKKNIGAFGGSAGAQLCMYLAFHHDLANPDSQNPLERESTRLRCVATSGGQTSMDVDWWLANIPGYDKPHRDFLQSFGTTDRNNYLRHVADVSALSLISKDDPPIFMSYRMAPTDPVPIDPQRAGGWKVHHVAFGVALKRKMDQLGIEAHLKYPNAKTKFASNVEFFKAELFTY